jgi:lipoprotein-anchoring transpeptidase ErfK/SrfK
MNHAAHDVPRSPGLRRGVSASGAALFIAGVVCVLAVPARAAAWRVPASQPLVVLLHDHVARTWPNASARRIESVSARRPLTGVRTVLPVLGYATSHGGNSWVHVRLPGRPQGHKGWILAAQTRRSSTEWRITIRLSTRQVTVYRDGVFERRFPAVVGKPSTPTPRGWFFIEEALAIPSQVGGPFALATSARSNVLQEFDGGPGQIALHGTDGLSGALGTAASHGCVRLSTSAITWLARRIGAGVPLTVN